MTLQLSSPAFDDGEPIPDRYGRKGENVSPPLSISGVPDDAVSLALVLDDPDALEPTGKIWDHWIVWNVPPEVEIPEAWDPNENGADEGANDAGGVGYTGPAPPDRPHTYRFRLFVLDARLDLPSGADSGELGDAMEGHVLAEAVLEGTFAP